MILFRQVNVKIRHILRRGHEISRAAVFQDPHALINPRFAPLDIFRRAVPLVAVVAEILSEIIGRVRENQVSATAFHQPQCPQAIAPDSHTAFVMRLL